MLTDIRSRALLVLSLWALRRPTRESLAVAGGAWSMYNAIHFLWHMLHLHVFPIIDKISVAVTLGGLLTLSIFMMLPVKEARPGSSVRRDEVAGHGAPLQRLGPPDHIAQHRLDPLVTGDPVLVKRSLTAG